MGVALPKSGGAVAGGTSADPIRTDPTGTTAQPVTGTVTVAGGKAGTPQPPTATRASRSSASNDALAARTSTDGDTAWSPSTTPAGCTPCPGRRRARRRRQRIAGEGRRYARARGHRGGRLRRPDRHGRRHLGRQVVTLDQIPENSLSGKATFSNTTAADVIAAQGVNIRIHVTDLVVTNAHASVGTKVEIRDGTTVLWQAYAAPEAAGSPTASRPPPPLRELGLTARCVTTGADVDVNASGFKAAI